MIADLRTSLETALKGGKGSGNWGHAGRPGKVGGSQPRVTNPEPFAGGVPEIISQVFPKSKMLKDNETGYWEQHRKTIEAMRAAGRTVTGYRYPSWKTGAGGSFEDVTAMQKVDNVQKIVDASGVEYGFVHGILRQWAKGSQTEWSLKFQDAVAEEFGLPVPRYIERKVKKLREETGWVPGQRFEKEKAKKVARAMYDVTQKTLRDMGIGPDDFITLYRGTNRSTLYNKENTIPGHPGVYRYSGNPIESWSLNYHTAAKFGRRRAKMAVKAKNIFSSSLSGIGCLSETEFIVFGSMEGYYANIL